jgi:hypothetical protein
MQKKLVEKIEKLIVKYYDKIDADADVNEVTNKYIEIKENKMLAKTIIKLLEIVMDLDESLEKNDLQSVEYKMSLTRLIQMNDVLSRNQELERYLDSIQ